MLLFERIKKLFKKDLPPIESAPEPRGECADPMHRCAHGTYLRELASGKIYEAACVGDDWEPTGEHHQDVTFRDPELNDWRSLDKEEYEWIR
jgi:hypothetical protein